MRRLVATAALLTVLAACAGPRNALNTSASGCFRGLPVAATVAGPKATVIGLRIVHRTELARKVSQAARIPAEVLCAVAYRGDFVPGDVRNADPAGPGRYAVVLLDSRGSHVLAAFVVDELPVRFRDRL
jgi:hypothetical protein